MGEPRVNLADRDHLWDLMEFCRVATHSRVFPKPLKPSQAMDSISSLVSLEEVVLLTETSRHILVLGEFLGHLNHPAGNLFHDIHTAVLMREHGVPEIVTADTDFLQFASLKVTNPLLRN